VVSVCTQYSLIFTCFLGRTRVQISNGISIGSAVFALLTADSRYTLQRAALSPLKLPLPIGDWNSHLTHGSLGPPESSISPNGISIGSVVFARLTLRQTDRQTDRPRYSVGNNRPDYMTYVVRRFGPIIRQAATAAAALKSHSLLHCKLLRAIYWRASFNNSNTCRNSTCCHYWFMIFFI